MASLKVLKVYFGEPGLGFSVHKSGMACPEKDSCTHQRVNKPLVYVRLVCRHPKNLYVDSRVVSGQIVRQFNIHTIIPPHKHTQRL